MIIAEKLKNITSPSNVAELMRSFLKKESKLDRDKEHFWAIGLTTKNQIKYIDLVSLGTLNSALIHPRETFRLAIIKGVNSIICVHNHPSNEITPSNEDIQVTNMLRKAGEILNIKVLDHIIINENSYYSFTDRDHL